MSELEMIAGEAFDKSTAANLFFNYKGFGVAVDPYSLALEKLVRVVLRKDDVITEFRFPSKPNHVERIARRN